MSTEQWQHAYIQANGIRFHYVTAGNGPLILLLHGFPENHYAWRYQIPVLSQHHKVVAPDLRGYCLTEKKGPYDIKTLAQDIHALILNLGYEKAIIVGHDWGALILWQVALDYPESCLKLISLNVPYFPRGPKPLHELLSDSRFDYIRIFQKPGIAEQLIEKDVDDFIHHVFSQYAHRRDYISEDDLRYFANALREPNAVTAVLSYYRNFELNWQLTKNQSRRKIDIPTLLVVADHDPLLTPELFIGVEKYVSHVTITHIDSGHFTQQEAPEETNHIILNFITNA